MSGCEGGNCSTCGSDDPDRLPPGMLKCYDINQSTADGTLVYLETIDGNLTGYDREILGKAKEITEGRLFAVVFGGLEIKRLYPEIFGYGVHTLYQIKDDRLATYHPEAYSECVTEIIQRIEPAIVLFPATVFGRELAPRVAALTKAGLTADCTDLRTDGRILVATRPAFGGSLVADIEYVGFPQIATVRPGAFPLPAKSEGQGTAIYWQFNGEGFKTLISETATPSEEDSIEDCDILISLGDGIRDRSLIDVAESVAKKLGGMVCCSRAIVDKGWMPRSRQVGMSGHIVSPKLYIAFGISGAVQHKAGMSGSGRIVAVNNDPHAPIHSIADISLLADAGDVLRSLDSKLRFLRAGYGARKDLLHMACDLHVGPGGLDLPVLANDEGRTYRADRLLAIGHLLAPGADLLHQDMVWIGEQLDLQLALVDELPVRCDRILAHPYDRYVAEHEIRDARRELLGLLGAPGSVVLRIEVDDIADAFQRSAVHHLSVLVLQLEFRENVSYVHVITQNRVSFFLAMIGSRSISKKPMGCVMPYSTTTDGAISPKKPMLSHSALMRAPLPGTNVA